MEKDVPSHSDLAEFVEVALKECEDLCLRLRFKAKTKYFLTRPITVKRNSFLLECVGGGEECSTVIECFGHSGFVVKGRRSSLQLTGLHVLHSQFHNDKAEIGACVFAMHQAEVSLLNCHLESRHGFALWLVQRAYVTCDDSTIQAPARSGCVSFGESSLVLRNSQVTSCGQHGVCCRGRVNLTLSRVTFVSCAVRSLYCYQSVCGTVEDCSFRQTRSSAHAAVEVRPSHGTGCAATNVDFTRCTFEDNAGGDLGVEQGAVVHMDGVRVLPNMAPFDHGPNFKTEAADSAAVWEWHDDDAGVWRQFSIVHSKQLEEAEQAEVLMEGGRWNCNVKTMEQTNMKTFYTRAIRKTR